MSDSIKRRSGTPKVLKNTWHHTKWQYKMANSPQNLWQSLKNPESSRTCTMNALGLLRRSPRCAAVRIPVGLKRRPCRYPRPRAAPCPICCPLSERADWADPERAGSERAGQRGLVQSGLVRVGWFSLARQTGQTEPDRCVPSDRCVLCGRWRCAHGRVGLVEGCSVQSNTESQRQIPQAPQRDARVALRL